MHVRRIARRAALCGALLTMVTPGLAVAQTPQDARCTPFSSGQADRAGEWASCLDVAVRLAEAPAVGKQARVDIEVRTTADRSDLTLDVRLPAGLEWVQTPAGLRSESSISQVPADNGKVHRAVGAGRADRVRPLRLSGTVRAVAEGSAEIRAVASTPGDADSGSAFLTVGAQRSTFGIAARDTNATAPADQGTRAHAHLAHKPAGPAAASAGTACATGTWGYVDHLGATRVSANAQVTVWDADTTGRHDLLATGLTDATGRFQLCFDNTDEDGTGQDVYAQFATENAHWMIQHGRTKKAFRFDSPVRADLAAGATADFGAVKPADPALMRGVEAFDVMNTAWNWTPGTCWDARDTTCRKGRINWAPDSTDGTYYSLRENAVHLAAADPDSNILVLHEFGHAIMDDVYEDDFPPAPDCSPHYIHRTSSQGCAWTEGFATWYGVVILNDPTFRWPDGRTRDLEGPTWGTSEWDNGDVVEGRVLGAMIDISDTSNEAGDTCTEDAAGPQWTTFLNHVSDTYRQFWAQRAADGYDVGPAALDCLYHNTIDYRR